MIEKLIELEKQLDNLGVRSNLDEITLLQFPDKFRQIHSFKIFGGDLLAIKEETLMRGEIDNFEKPFKFLSEINELEIFEQKFSKEISNEFVQIGYTYDVSEIVFLNKLKNTIHILHVQDFKLLKKNHNKLKNSICTLEQFISFLKPQTVCCFRKRISLNPEYEKFDDYEIFEIKNDFVLRNEDNYIKYSDNETVWNEYYKLVENAVNRGFEVNYAPRKVIDMIV